MSVACKTRASTWTWALSRPYFSIDCWPNAHAAAVHCKHSKIPIRIANQFSWFATYLDTDLRMPIQKVIPGPPAVFSSGARRKLRASQRDFSGRPACSESASRPLDCPGPPCCWLSATAASLYVTTTRPSSPEVEIGSVLAAMAVAGSKVQGLQRVSLLTVVLLLLTCSHTVGLLLVVTDMGRYRTRSVARGPMHLSDLSACSRV